MVHFIVMDVDGTLTDGKIYMGQNGELFKAFDVKDGYGIKEILPSINIIPIIITARYSDILNKRCEELGIEYLFQGVRNKIERLTVFLKKKSEEDNTPYDLSMVAYIGDDLLDLQCMVPTKRAGGIVACPQDAVKEVIEIATFVSTKKGGEGAVREFIEYLKMQIVKGNNGE